MRNGNHISVVIPALNEAKAIGQVLAAVPGWVDTVIVADNGSSDGTAEISGNHGARVVTEMSRGYGNACLAGVAALPDETDVLVFLDADFSDVPEEMHRLVDPICRGNADLVISSRMADPSQPDNLTIQQRWGNRLACLLIRWIWRYRYTDLGPFRAVRMSAYKPLAMADRNYGWTIEMQIKAVEQNLDICEVPVAYRARIGISKISGTVRGVIGAGSKILTVIAVFAARKYSRNLNAAITQTIQRLLRIDDTYGTRAGRN